MVGVEKFLKLKNMYQNIKMATQATNKSLPSAIKRDITKINIKNQENLEFAFKHIFSIRGCELLSSEEMLFFSKANEHYMSNLKRYKCNYVEHSQKIELLKCYFFVKIATSNDQKRLGSCTYECFKREIFFYDEILPEFVKLLKSKNAENIFENYATLYLSSGLYKNEFMIVKDLAREGFRTLPKSEPLDNYHIAFVLRHIAQFHAISHVFKQENNLHFKSLARNSNNFIAELFKLVQTSADFLENGKNMALECIEDFQPEVIKQFKNGINNFNEFLENISNPKNMDKYCVITHGDLWTNNIMFRYFDRHQIKDMTLIDFQLARYWSPVIDFSYFICNCSNTVFLNENFESYKHLYYESFNKFVRKLGYDPDELFPIEAFEDHLQKYFQYGIYMSVCTLALFTEHNMIAPKEKQVPNENYRRRMRGIIEFSAKHNYL